MIAAVLSPGPSLLRYPAHDLLRVSEATGGKPRPYDVVVGVNRAAGLHACDFWCLLDHYTYGLTEVIGKPTIVCHASIFRSMGQAYAAAKLHPHLSLENIKLEHGTVDWRTYSAMLAIAVAFLQGAELIECYGMDWKGAADYDGHTNDKQRRNARRWETERKLFDRLCDMFAPKGCIIRRVGLTDAT